jgi:catechol 2,3-dioxygenase-like lactoylglutathione lyase family enzyme
MEEPAMMTPARLQGLNHLAFPTFDPVATIHFYGETLGLPLTQTMQVQAWGPEYQKDFVHFFFDIGNDDCIAFFYYFGQEPYHDDALPPLLDLGKHVALHVETVEMLDEYQRRLEAGGYPIDMRVMHETVESIYVRDPNDILVEIARPLRKLVDADAVDARMTSQALLTVAGGADPSLAKLWRRKAELIRAEYDLAPPGRGQVSVFFLDVAEFADVAAVARAVAGARTDRVGGYVQVTVDGPLAVDRRTAGVRHAVWYSSVAAVDGGHVAQFDKDTLRVEPGER